MNKREIMFGRNLRVLRNKKGMTQEELASELHVTRQTISVWERGEGKPDIYYLTDICTYFDINVEKMLYEKVIDVLAKRIENAHQQFALEFSDAIRGYDNQGFFTIIDEDLQDFFPIIEYSFEKIMVIALELHRRGYVVVEVFGKGFSIYFRNSIEATNFQKVLYNIIDCFIHHDNDYMESKINDLSEPLYEIESKIIRKVMSEIYGAELNSFSYYWIDEEENVRGYACSEEACKIQAKEQRCDTCIVLSII